MGYNVIRCVMNVDKINKIGTIGKKWGKEEKDIWYKQQNIKRSYQQEVVAKLANIDKVFKVEQYGSLSYDVDKYPLFAVISKQWDKNKPSILITGGVHGYETSGVQGALRFVQESAIQYDNVFNIVVVPCVSPWGYETINRWNPKAIDPNRSFYSDSPAEESCSLMKLIASFACKFTAHIDLHETTDTDNSQFRPALAARDAEVHDNWNIPDGFYLVGDTNNPVEDFQKAIIDKVKAVTHIAPADENEKLIGVSLSQFGVINYETKKLALCIGFTDATYCTTTEVYPDSTNVTDEDCIKAQVAAIHGGLDFIKVQHSLDFNQG